MTSATPTRRRSGVPRGPGSAHARQAPATTADRTGTPVVFRLTSRSGQSLSFRLQQLVLLETAEAAVLLGANNMLGQASGSNGLLAIRRSYREFRSSAPAWSEGRCRRASSEPHGFEVDHNLIIDSLRFYAEGLAVVSEAV